MEDSTRASLDLLLGEYKELKAEQRDRMGQRDGMTAATISAQVLAVAAVAAGKAGPELLLALPPIAFALGWIRLATADKVSKIRDYIRGPLRLEAIELVGTGRVPFGWETHKSPRRTSRKFGQLVSDLVVFVGGPLAMRSQGNIVIGDWVRTSATPGAVETTCVSMTHHRPVPKGTVGLAVTTASGECVTILKFATPSNGMQGFSLVRNNRSQTCTSTNLLTCNAVMLIADALQLVDCNNDIVIVTRPNPVTNDIRVDSTNQKNGRDQQTAFSAGDVHFYFVYEGCSGTVYSRSSVNNPRFGGPTMPTCETNWAY